MEHLLLDWLGQLVSIYIIDILDKSFEYLIDHIIKSLSDGSEATFHDYPIEHLPALSMPRVECFAASSAGTPEFTTQCKNLFVKILVICPSWPMEQDLLLVQDRELFIWFFCIGNSDVEFTSLWVRVHVLVVYTGSYISSNGSNVPTFWTLLIWCGYVSDAGENKLN